jgi:hypothetical protein
MDAQPELYEKALKRIDDFPSEKDWDSYGADPTTEEARMTARAFAEMFIKNFWIGPTNHGGVSIEIDQRDGYSLILDFNPDGTPESVYVETPKGKWEHEWTS